MRAVKDRLLLPFTCEKREMCSVNARRLGSTWSPIRLEKAFGGGAETWLRMQAAYDLAKAEKRIGRIKVRRVTTVSAPA